MDEAAGLAERLLADAEPDELQTRVRALHVLGRTHAWRGDPGSLAAAERMLGEAAELYVHLGYPAGSVHARLALAYDVYTLGGRPEDAVRTLTDALAVLPARSRLRGVLLAFVAEALIDLGRYEEAEATLTQAATLGSHLGDSRTSAYTSWLLARIAARVGEADRLRALLAAAEETRGEWFDHHSGVEFLAEAAVLLDQVGDHRLADAYLARALERRHEAPRYVELAQGTLTARRGEPEEAERILAEAAGRPDLEARERWHVSLLRALAARRGGREEPAASFAREAFENAAALGHPELPLLREPTLAAELLPLAASAGSAAAGSLTPEALPLEVTILGRFSVGRGGRPSKLPPGRPTLLVAFVAAMGGRVAADEAIETLWPGVEPASGRKRLRNILNRLRAGAGEIVARDGEMLTFPPGTVVDATAFERAVAAVLADSAAPDSPGRARAALDRYPGTLLPDLPYADWAAEPRERLRARQLALLDLLANAAEQAGDADEALRFLEQAIEVDRFDESRYLQAARLQLAQGRRGRALKTLRDAAGAVRQLGLEPSAEHRRLVAATRG